MKIRFTLILLALFQISLNHVCAQSLQNENSGLPLNPNRSILFGKDIVINDTAMGDQRNVAICSAFNGWLYAAYWVKEVGSNVASMQLTIMKSEDSGMNWDVLRTILTGGPREIFSSFKIAVCGNDLTNLKLFLGLIYYDTLYHSGTVVVPRFNGITGETETDILNDQSVDAHDIDIATDYNYPASNSDPGSFAILYSKHQGSTDSLIFYSSSNGGMTLNNHRVVSKSSDQFQFRKVALNYGRSSSYIDGQYFAAWELISINNSDFDHIYTAHSELNINGPFTNKVCLDSIDLSTINKCKNPVICCQFGGFDNDSSNMTEVILAENQDISNNYYKVVGFYNRNAATSNHFTKFNLTSTAHYETQPWINFNPYDSTFMVTYFDSTNKKLPFLTNDVNLANPNSWNIVSQGYNDNSSLVAPYPKVKLNFGQQEGMNVWISEGTNSNGIAMFDAPYSTYSGSSEINTDFKSILYGAYPNPCSTEVTIWFEIQNPEKVTTTLYDISNHILKISTSQTCQAGRGVVKFDISTLSPGCYFYSLSSDKFSGSGKVIVIE